MVCVMGRPAVHSVTNVPGEIYKIKALGTQIVFVCSAALLEEICDQTRFRKCVTGPIVEIRYSVHDSLFTAYDNEPSWGIAHRIMYPLLTKSSIEDAIMPTGELTSFLTAKWVKSGSQRFDITDDLRRLNILTTVKCLFDQDIQTLEGPEPSIINAMEQATQEAVKRPTRPKILNSLLFQKKFDADTKTMRDFAAEIVKKRRAENGEKSDMLNALLNGKDPESGKSLTESEIIDEIVSLLIGTVTAPNFVAFTIYYLLKNPEKMTEAYKEIDAVLPKGETINASHITKLNYVEAVLRESMRLSAPAPGFNIEPIPGSTAGPVLLAGGKYEIPANQVIITVLSKVNRDPAVFEDAEEFRPERMIGEAYDKLPAGVKKGFGNGKRECIGKLYAWQWSMVTLTCILRAVNLKLAEPTYQLKMDGAFSVKPVGFYGLATSRSSNATQLD
jgi:cytochrome P450